MPSATRRLAARLLPLALLWSGCVVAAPPTEAQVERLLTLLDVPQLLDQILAQVDDNMRIAAERELGPHATPEQRAKLERVLERERRSMREVLDWNRLRPMYIRIYTQTFTTEEIDAMVAFYGSETGHAIRAKLPRAMQLAGEESRPLIEDAVDRLQRDIDRELHDDGKAAPDRR